MVAVPVAWRSDGVVESTASVMLGSNVTVGGGRCLR